jgi:hypothetical protein
MDSGLFAPTEATISALERQPSLARVRSDPAGSRAARARWLRQGGRAVVRNTAREHASAGVAWGRAEAARTGRISSVDPH